MTAVALRKAVLAVCCLPLAASMASVADAQIPGLPSGKVVSKAEAIFGPFDEWVASVAFSPDGKHVAVGTYDAIRIHRWGMYADKGVTLIAGKLGRVRALEFSPDGSQLLAGGFRKIAVIDTTNWKITKELTGHRAYVTGLSVSPDGKSLASSSEDATLRLWDLSSSESKVLYSEKEDPVTDVSFSPGGRMLAVASGDDTRPTRPGHVRLINASSGAVIHELESHARATTGVAFSPDGKYVASTGQDEKVKLHSAESGKEIREYDGHSRPTNAVRFTPSGRQVVSVSGGRAVGKNEIHVWDTATGETTWSNDAHEGPVFSVSVSKGGTQVLTGSRDGTARIWNVANSGAAQQLITGGAANLAKLAQSLTKKVVGAATPSSDGKKAEADSAADEPREVEVVRVGMIGLDTSHCLAFTKLLNADNPGEDLAGFRVVAVYPKGSPDIESSVSRVPKYTEEIKKLGVEVIDDLDEMVSQVDAVLLETNDGRPHLEQIVPVLKAGLPVFVDKPVAGSLTDAVAMYELSRHYKTPFFSSSSLRFSTGPQELRSGAQGKILGCSTYSPCSLEKTHPDLFWYGIHGVEMLFTVMGPGCKSVTRASSADFELVTGTWADGRIGTFRGIRSGRSGYGGTAFCEKGIVPVGKYDGYRPLVVEIVKFFRTKQVPVSEEETLDIYAFMEAADESKRQSGAPVLLESVLQKARTEAAAKVQQILSRAAEN